MKKYLSIFLLAMLCWGTVAYAQVKLKQDGTDKGQVISIDYKHGPTVTRDGAKGSVDYSTLTNVTLASPTITGVATISGLTRPTGGINWNDLPTLYKVNNYAVNWNDIQGVQQSSTGVNWNFMETTSGGINWTKVSNGATASNIVCWKSTGQLGKCTTGVSGVGCTACN